MNPATKKCPDCAEDVRAEARKCRFCGFIFPEPPATVPEPEQPPEQLQPVNLEATHTEQQDQPKREFKAKWGRIEYTVLAFCILLILVVYLAVNPHKSADNSARPENAQTADDIAQMQAIPAAPKAVRTPTPATIQQQEGSARTENKIRIDTTGCLTIDAFDRTASVAAASVPGCIDLDRGQRIIGPLEVKIIRHGNSDFRYARIEVPGKGERWTFLSHLEK